MHDVDLLFFYCWQFIVLKNSQQFKSTKIQHGYQLRVKLFVSITVRTVTYESDFVIGLYKRSIIFQRNHVIKNIHFSLIKNSRRNGSRLIKINLFSVYRISAESAAAPVCIQLSRSEYKPTRECLFDSFHHLPTS